MISELPKELRDKAITAAMNDIRHEVRSAGVAIVQGDMGALAVACARLRFRAQLLGVGLAEADVFEQSVKNECQEDDVGRVFRAWARGL